MMNRLQEILDMIGRGELLGEATFANLDIDAAVQARENPEFEMEWMRVFKTLKQVDLEIEVTKEIDVIRELAFKRAYKITEDSDIAAFVSDDFEIVCKALVVGLHDVWLSRLFESYRKAVFPTVIPQAGQ